MRQLEWGSQQQQSYAANRKLALAANQAVPQLRYDLVMYGDSITAALRQEYAAVWERYFGDWRSAALGVGQSTVEELTWRLMAGGERLAEDPRVVVVHIGTNNQWGSQPAAKLGYLLGWMEAAMPGSRVLVLAMLPSKIPKVTAMNQLLRQEVERHGGVLFSTCGSDIDPTNERQLYDGVHPTEDGYTRIFRCLKPLLADVLRANP
jgi:lysophospholipase L1-like esterase